ncbi:MAG: protein tyrosine phosphatase family protein [Alphaproteobacteria bacterium]
MVEDILNFYAPITNIGTGGQPTESQLADIAGAGYTSLINLAMNDSDNVIPEEGNIAASYGMAYIHMPIPFDAPNAGHLRKFFRLMDALEGERVFVHCAVNARVSAFMYQYLTLQQGVAEEVATSPLLTKWLPQMDEKWQAILALKVADIA